MTAAGKLRYAMIGGGRGAFIGAVHRIAAALDGRCELVAGAFSSVAEISQASGAELRLPPERCYGDYETLLRCEKDLPAEERCQFVVIVTPNHLHYGPAKLALENGFDVVSDKPATLRWQEARELEALARANGRLYAITYNYTGYPMVKEARRLVQSGQLGVVRKVMVEYTQGWLSSPLEASGQKQAAWRTDPARAGLAGCVGDIGTHAENLLHYVTGLTIRELAADLTAFVPGRQLDDDASILLRFEGGAKGVLQCSQICVGEENNLSLRVYGERGSCAWHQQEPNSLWVKWGDQPTQIFRTAASYLGEEATASTRIPAGHPEGYLEAFATIYRNIADTLAARAAGRQPSALETDFPTIADGVRGMAFIEAAVASSRANAAWTSLPS